MRLKISDNCSVAVPDNRLKITATSVDYDGVSLVGTFYSSTAAQKLTGALIVTGGPQYRVGAHQQFVKLACCLAEQGFPVLLFDHLGMGDSAGKLVPYGQMQSQIHAAAQHIRNCFPLSRLIVIGLCEGATAALITEAERKFSAGLVLINPWIPDEKLAAQTKFRIYYSRRFLSFSFWKDLLEGKINLGTSIRGL